MFSGKMFLVFAALCLVLVQVTNGKPQYPARRVFAIERNIDHNHLDSPRGMQDKVGMLIGVNFLLATAFNKAIQVCRAVFIPQVLMTGFGRGHGR